MTAETRADPLEELRMLVADWRGLPAFEGAAGFEPHVLVMERMVAAIERLAALTPPAGSVPFVLDGVWQREPGDSGSRQGAVTEPAGIDARLLAQAMRDVDVVEKRPVDSYVGLATEIAAAYLRAALTPGAPDHE